MNGESEGSGMKQPRPARRTRNTGRFYDEHGSSFTPKHDAIDLFASMILSKIDEESYEHAAWEDADRVMQNHVLPKCLPWSKPRVPLLRNLPRDIEDMQGVWHAGEDAEGVGYRKHINSGSLGYGMYDMGGLSKDDVKGTRAETIIAAKPSIGNSDTPLSPARTRRMSSNEDAGATSSKEESEIPLEYSDDTLTAAARRSDDPGIIELTGQQCMNYYLIIYLFSSLISLPIILINASPLCVPCISSQTTSAFTYVMSPEVPAT